MNFSKLVKISDSFAFFFSRQEKHKKILEVTGVI